MKATIIAVVVFVLIFVIPFVLSQFGKKSRIDNSFVYAAYGGMEKPPAEIVVPGSNRIDFPAERVSIPSFSIITGLFSPETDRLAEVW